MMAHTDVIKSYAGSGVTGGAALAAWFTTNMPVFEGVSLIISIVAGAVTIVYTLKKIFEKKS